MRRLQQQPVRGADGLTGAERRKQKKALRFNLRRENNLKRKQAHITTTQPPLPPDDTTQPHLPPQPQQPPLPPDDTMKPPPPPDDTEDKQIEEGEVVAQRSRPPSMCKSKRKRVAAEKEEAIAELGEFSHWASGKFEPPIDDEMQYKQVAEGTLTDVDRCFIDRDGQQIVPDSVRACLLYTSPSPRDISGSRMPSSA